MTDDLNSAATYCGFIAIIGRPNVGKSTLLNHVLGTKISITADKPQTTRHRILGVKTQADHQAIFVDTPGIHNRQDTALNKTLNKTALAALIDVDVICFMVEALQWTAQDNRVLSKLTKSKAPVILLINKIDQVKDKQLLLPFIEKISAMHQFHSVLPLSAEHGDNIATLTDLVMSLLPASPHYFPADQITDRNNAFLATELVREQLTRRLGDELPYGLGVAIEAFEQEPKLIKIRCLIWVNKQSHKQIIIGTNGEQLKRIGIEARKGMERLFGRKVFLGLWVKVKENWVDDQKHLQHLGYSDQD